MYALDNILHALILAFTYVLLLAAYLNVQLFQMCEPFCRSLKGLSFCVNFFELISYVAMVFTCGVPGCTTGY